MTMKKYLYYVFISLVMCCTIFYRAIATVGEGDFKRGCTHTFVNVGNKFADIKLYSPARRFYYIGYRLHGNDYWSQSNIAWAYYMQARNMHHSWDYRKQLFEKALDYYLIVYSNYPRDISTLNSIGDTCIQLEEFEKAVSWYEKSLNVKERQWYVYSKLARLYSDFLEQKDYEKALYYADKYIEYRKKDDIEPYFTKAWILSRIDTREKDFEAIEYYEKYIQGNPENLVAPLVNISGLENSVGNYDKAIEYANEGRKHNYNSHYLLGNLAHAYIGKKDYKKAKEYLNKMLEDGWTDYTAYWYLAKIALLEGNKEDAEKFFELSKKDAQVYVDENCQANEHDLYDIDGNCRNREQHLKDFEKHKYDLSKFK